MMGMGRQVDRPVLQAGALRKVGLRSTTMIRRSTNHEFRIRIVASVRRAVCSQPPEAWK